METLKTKTHKGSLLRWLVGLLGIVILTLPNLAQARSFQEQVKVYEDSLVTVQKTELKSREIYLLYKLGTLCFDSTRYAESLRYLSGVNNIPGAASKAGPDLWSKYCYQIGITLRFIGQLTQAAEWMERGLKSVRKTRDAKLEMLMHANLLEFRSTMGETDAAIALAPKYISSAYKAGDSLHIAYAYHLLADLLVGNKQFEAAKVNSDKACYIAKKARQFSILSYIYCDYSHLYEGMDQLDKATYYANKSIKNALRYYPILATFPLIDLAKVDYRRGLYGTSIEKLLKVKADMYKVGNTIAMLSCMHLLAQCYQAQKKFPLAIATTNEMITVADQTFNQRMSEAGKKLLPALYAESGQFQVAYLQLQKQMEIQAQKLKQSNELTNKLELLQLEERNKLLRAQQELRVKAAQSRAQRNFLGMAIVLTLGIMVFLLLHNRFLREKAKGLLLKAEAHQKQEELSAFNYSLGHDLRAPLSNAQVFLDRFEAKFEKIDRESSEYFQKLRLILDDTNAMIMGMLNYAQQDELPLFESTIDCKKEVENLAKTYQEIEVDRKIEFEISDLPVLHGDKLMLRQAFSNLLSNAVKYTRLQPVAKIRVSAQLREGFWEIMIQDNGVGIPDKGTERVFQLFKTVHDRAQFPGVGVGLSIVKRIIERHRGEIWVRNNPEGGAQFGFSIPAL